MIIGLISLIVFIILMAVAIGLDEIFNFGDLSAIIKLFLIEFATFFFLFGILNILRTARVI